MLIEIDGTNYELDTKQAIASGALIKKLETGDVYRFPSSSSVLIFTHDIIDNHWRAAGRRNGLGLWNDLKDASTEEVLAYIRRNHMIYCGNINEIVEKAITEIV